LELNYNKEKNYCTIKLKGILSRDEILHAFNAAVSHIYHVPGMGRLWDFCEADLSLLSSDTINSMAQYSLRFPNGINNVKVAFVVGRELEYGLTRMFEAFSSNAKTTIKIFKSLEQAKKWISS